MLALFNVGSVRHLQAHLKKLFAGIHSVGFGEEGMEIVSMRSLDGEEVPLFHTVPITADVEVRGKEEGGREGSTIPLLCCRCG